MKFARRAEGISAARAVFKKAREDKKSTYHVSLCDLNLMPMYNATNIQVQRDGINLAFTNFV